MKFASFEIGNSSTWGVIEGEEAIDVGSLLRDRYPDLKSAIAADALPAAREAVGNAKRYTARSDACSHIAGYACYNEGSVRDFQRHTHQFTSGKNFPGTGAFGPWMMTPDELGDVTPLRLRTRLNGQIVQDATIDQMIFDIPRQIEYCSSFTRLEPGDVIATGTPGGVGSRRTPSLWLKPGDIVEVEIDRLGVLRNGVADET